MIYPRIVIDLQKLQEAFRQLITQHYRGPTDTLTEAVRIAAGKPDLQLTKEQRQQVKLALHSTAYGMSSIVFMDALTRLKGI